MTTTDVSGATATAAAISTVTTATNALPKTIRLSFSSELAAWHGDKSANLRRHSILGFDSDSGSEAGWDLGL